MPGTRKECEAKSALYRRANKDNISGYNKEYYKANKDRILAQQKEYRKAIKNPERNRPGFFVDAKAM